MEYNFKKIEAKWQKKWEKEKIFEVKENPKRDKFYCLIEFPYPSGEGLHVGHPRSYTALDIVARKNRMRGKNVLYPIGWDAFGLPAENYAIKTGIHPAIATAKNIKNFKRQLKSFGLSFDWSREINTTDPEYYKWTQWMFLQFFKHGLAYKAEIPVNWCTKCETGLANEEVVNNECERCGGPVVKKTKEQWMLKITKYAERLISDLEKVDYAPRIKEQQINWIGKSEGAEVDFAVILRTPPAAEESPADAGAGTSPEILRFAQDDNHKIKVFTTRPDTLFGATYMVLAPEHDILEKIKKKITNWPEIEKYIDETKRKSDLERTELQKEKTGVELKGIKAVNPVNNEDIPVWVADYVLTGYGTGAIMAVPAHDERDFTFAKKFGLPIREVVVKKFGERRTDAVRRDSVAGVVLNKEKKVLVLHDKKFDIYRLPAGGYEKNETPEETLKREIQEESGYVNIKIEEFLGTIETNFDVIFKKEYRHKFQKGYLARLLGDEQGEMNEEGKEIFEKTWLDYGEAMKRFDRNKESWGEEEFIRRVFEPKEKCFAGDGTAINSDFLDGLPTAEAKEKITKWLEEKKIGKKSVNYKLRDWVFSRQRYWGEPIPLVYCEQCAKKKQKVLMIHGFEGGGEANWLPWLKKELEARGFEVFNPTMSTSEHPIVESWMKELLPFTEKMGEDDIIIGYSLGSKAALHLVEKAKKKIGHLFLIASAIGSLEERDWSWFKKEWKDSDVDALRKFWEAPVKWETVDKLVGSKNLVLSDDDPYVKKETRKNLPPGWFYQLWSGFGHFDFLKKSPEILDLVLTAKNTGWVPVEEKDLPVELPKVKEYKPTATGESPLASVEKWVKIKCPKCGGEARRETDTMPNWAGSSWYFLRYTDPKNKKEFAGAKNLKYWMPVDWYNGGMEHNNLHLLYSRFWYKFLYDIGAIPKECGDEPYKKRTSHGLILGEGGAKMSKSRGNVVNPDDVVARFGADTLRIYEMFMGPFEQAIPWDEKGVVGVFRFLERVWNIKLTDKEEPERNKDFQIPGAIQKVVPWTPKDWEIFVNKTIKKISGDIDAMKFNTAVSALMIFVNEFYPKYEMPKKYFEIFLKLLAPFAPHLAEELWWGKLDKKESIHGTGSGWPEIKGETVEEELDLIVQINGKMRASVRVKADISGEEAKKVATESEKIKKWIEGQKIKKIIFVKGRLVNIVV